jgi:two-component system, chemotaxis family, chemotaxis protein CheY
VRRNCLIVDDSRVARHFARKLLEGPKFAIQEAADGELALKACASGMPDLILLDWNMPVMNGIEFLRALRVMNQGAKPVVLFCTTENQLDRVVEALEAGANEYIMKPFDGEILTSKLALMGIN